MIRQDEVQVGVVLRFLTPDESDDLVGPVSKVEDGLVWMCRDRWPLDVVARESTIIPKPTTRHRWDGALNRWYLPEGLQSTGDGGIVLSHVRHA